MCGGGYGHLIDLLKRQEIRIKIGIPLDAILLISVGELSVRKNHKVVVEALQILSEQYWYVIVGKGDLKDELENIDNTGRLKLLGYRTDIVDLLHASDVFVFPSLQEGLPVALMEAMAAGLSVVATEIRGNVDLISHGEGGYFFDHNDVEGLVEVMKKIERSSSKEMGKHNIEKIIQFDIENVRNEMLRIYQSLT